MVLDNKTMVELAALGIDPRVVYFFPPDWVHPRLLNPNYVPTDIGGVILGVCYTTVVLATLVVCARLFARATLVWSLSIDDWLIIPAMVSGFCSQSVSGVLPY